MLDSFRSTLRDATRARQFWLACPVGLSLAAAACGGAAGQAEHQETAQVRQVQVVPALEDRLARTVAVTGTLAAEEQVTLSMKVTGRLDQLLVDLGSRVSKGQTIARLVPTDFTLRMNQSEAALLQARARLGLPPDGSNDTVDPEQTAVVREARAVLDEAELTQSRARTFFEQGISPKADLDAASASFKVAESRYQDAQEEVRNRQGILQQRRSELELARQALQDSTLTSPMDGMVRERQATVGQYLAAGTPVVTIVRVHPLRLRLAIPEREAASIRLKQDVRVTVEGDSRPYEGRIARISPAIDEGSRTMMIEAEVPNADGQLRPGSFANAEIVVQAHERAIVVPTSAIVTFAGVDKVLIVKDGQSLERRVSTGRRAGDRVEIVNGLQAGEQVIVEPGNMIGGEKVSVANASSSTGPADGRAAAK